MKAISCISCIHFLTLKNFPNLRDLLAIAWDNNKYMTQGLHFPYNSWSEMSLGSANSIGGGDFSLPNTCKVQVLLKKYWCNTKGHLMIFIQNADITLESMN